VVRGSVAPALTLMAMSFPSKGHTVKGALPQLGAMVGIPPALVRSRFDAITELMACPQLLRTSIAFMETQQKRELILAMALAVEPDILLVDIPIQDTPFAERCTQRIDHLCARGTLVVAEMRLVPNRLITLEAGRLVDAAPATP
jgi:energy-coupling factor transporter ATP-binding protein EcfA2